MFYIFTLFSLVFLWASIAGATITTQRYIKNFHIARATAILLFCLILFFVEHFIGLGNLEWLFPITTIYGGWLMLNRWQILKDTGFWSGEMVFAIAFMYGFFWRLMFPNISPSSEQLTDLFFIVNYMGGTTLPPLDHWNPPHLFDYYYAFQHYSASLMGRIMGLDPGPTYSYAIALIGALPIALAWSIASEFLQKRSLKILLVATMAIGGTGMSPLFHLVYDNPASDSAIAKDERAKRSKTEHYARENIIGSARFIGGSRDTNIAGDKTYNKGVGSFFFPNTPWEGQKMVLPGENFGYQYFIGDYHPTLGGFFLLLLALALLLSIEKGKQLRFSQAGLTFLIPVMMITNTWTFPLLVILVFGWLVHRMLLTVKLEGAKLALSLAGIIAAAAVAALIVYIISNAMNSAIPWLFYIGAAGYLGYKYLWPLIVKMPVDWLWLIGGGLLGTFLIYPFFLGFVSGSLSTPVKLVETEGHTPISRFLALQWPVLLLIAMSFFVKQYRRLTVVLALSWLFMLVLSEVIYIDDPTGDHFRRTNTVMKWWGWIQVGSFISLGVLCLSSSIKAIRWITVATFVLVNFYAIDVLNYWRAAGKWDFGKLQGHAWYTRDRVDQQVFEYLDAAPHGIVMENVYDNAYVNTSVYSIYARKPVLLGWRSHLMTWHGSVPREWILGDEIQQFYKNEMADPLPWLKAHDVRYIVFGPKETNGNFDAINEKIKRDYQWLEFNHSRSRHNGIWVRKENN